MKVSTVGRWILTEYGLENGFLRFEGDDLVEVCWGDPPTETVKGIVMPAFVNAHTHIGDSVAYPAPKGTVKEIVGPPDGYKHKMLKTCTSDEKTSAMRSALETMRSSGTCLFADFREEGVEGVQCLRAATVEEWPRPVVFGRPDGPEPRPGEVEALLKTCDGLGFSAISDLSLDVLKSTSRKAHSAGKKFAIHASEAVREDIDQVLDLDPDFIVHMCKASEEDLIMCEEAGVPVVVCPSSNRFFGLDPGIPRLLRLGLTVGLGTDNGMIARPDMISELRIAYSLSSPEVSPLDIVQLATFGGRKVLNADAKITTEISEKSDLVVIRTASDDPLEDLVTRAGSEDIAAVYRGGKAWRTSAWRT